MPKGLRVFLYRDLPGQAREILPIVPREDKKLQRLSRAHPTPSMVVVDDAHAGMGGVGGSDDHTTDAEIDLTSYKRDEWDLDEDLLMRQKEK